MKSTFGGLRLEITCPREHAALGVLAALVTYDELMTSDPSIGHVISREQYEAFTGGIVEKYNTIGLFDGPHVDLNSYMLRMPADVEAT